jgi:hypothetical protein
VLDIAENGDATEVDMLVRDIYGGDYGGMNLSASMVASSFGKLVMKEHPREGIKEEDLAIALLMMITNNIGQVAYLNAQVHKCSKIFFVGSFLRHNPISCRRLAFAIDFWSKGVMEAVFLSHEGYFGGDTNTHAHTYLARISHKNHANMSRVNLTLTSHTCIPISQIKKNTLALGTFLQSAFGSDVDNILSLVPTNGEVDTALEEKTEEIGRVDNDTSGHWTKTTVENRGEIDGGFIQRIKNWRPIPYHSLHGAKSQSTSENSRDNRRSTWHKETTCEEHHGPQRDSQEKDGNDAKFDIRSSRRSLSCDADDPTL